jgi:hypothetical protein
LVDGFSAYFSHNPPHIGHFPGIIFIVAVARAAIIDTWLGKAHPISEASPQRKFRGDVLRDCALDAERTHANAKVVAEK